MNGELAGCPRWDVGAGAVDAKLIEKLQRAKEPHGVTLTFKRLLTAWYSTLSVVPSTSTTEVPAKRLLRLRITIEAGKYAKPLQPWDWWTWNLALDDNFRMAAHPRRRSQRAELGETETWDGGEIEGLNFLKHTKGK